MASAVESSHNIDKKPLPSLKCLCKYTSGHNYDLKLSKGIFNFIINQKSLRDRFGDGYFLCIWNEVMFEG